MAGRRTVISVAEAQQRLLALAVPSPMRNEPLAACCGRWLAEPLVALRTQPWADLSAMDGYALAPGAGPWRVVRAIPAECRESGMLAPGEAARIFTGAPLPTGADRILIQEEAQRDDDILSLLPSATPPSPGRYIRRAGADFAAGTMLAPAGSIATAPLIALAAVAGHASLTVHAPTPVHILATGSELIEPGAEGAGASTGLPSSNGPMLEAMLAPLPFATARNAGIVADDLAAISARIAAFEADTPSPALLLLTGGASVGDHDLVRPALEAQGWQIVVHKVAVKPGKPLMVATKGGRIAIGLPGNPVSAFVTATLFALPLLRAMAGCPAPLPQFRPVRFTAPLAAGGEREEYLRCRITPGGQVLPLNLQDSGMLAALAMADALIRVPAHAPPQDAGAMVDYITIA